MSRRSMIAHWRHPVRAMRGALTRAARQREMARIVQLGERRFGRAGQADLEMVAAGFASRIDQAGDDSKLLERICSAYAKAVNRQQVAAQEYQATKWWEQTTRERLAPARKALLERDFDALRTMYRNFFRDACSTGLVGVPDGWVGKSFHRTIGDLYRRFYLNDVLHRIDLWKRQTKECCPPGSLTGPAIGNPFGIIRQGVLVEEGAPQRHYYAHRVFEALDSANGVVAEIGGGFGGMAYYLLRDRPQVKYLDFDLPESIALAAYYLMKAFPERTFLLYGEDALSDEAVRKADIALMPLFELASMPAGSVDVTFSSHAMSDLPLEAAEAYLCHISTITRRYFLHITGNRSVGTNCDLTAGSRVDFSLIDTRFSAWHAHKIPGTSERESLYLVGTPCQQ